MAGEKPHPNSAVQVAVRLLAQRALSKGELRSKLSQRGFDSEALELALATMQNYGYLNDEKLVASIIEQAQNSGRGIRFINHTLQRRQLAPTSASVQLLPCSTTEQQIALRALKKRFASLDDRKSKLRAYNFLASRGFTASLARAALQAYDQPTNT